jgi:cytokinin riboside 5'-monophosphate phosphoribohydrolase
VRFTVYTSSSDAVDERYRSVARAFGYRIGERGDALVYGGTEVGLMGILAGATREAGGHVTGVLPQLMADRGLADEACDELIVTDGMGDRKRAMYERADAFVALPGGFGTLEELLEVLTLKQLGYHRKPVVLVDVDGFWQPLLATFEHLFDLDFAKREYARLWFVAPDLDALFDHVDTYDPGELPTKWY